MKLKNQKELDKLWDLLQKKNPKTLTKFREGWERYKLNKSGMGSIRCQARIPGSTPEKQCKNIALKGLLVCIDHVGGRSKQRKKNIVLIKKKLGIYDLGEHRALSKELQEVEDLSPDEIEGLYSELKLSIALLRGYLKATPDEEIKRKPSKLMWLIDNISRFKKTHYDMVYAPKTSFTREQVEYMLSKIKGVIIDIVKDPDMLEKISLGIKNLGIQLREEGFK